MTELLYENEAYKIRGAIFEVYREMGSGFLEAVYQECLALEMRCIGIDFEIFQTLNLTYKDQALVQTYRPDFVCYGKIILELKATEAIGVAHRAQLLNYLKATGMRLGLLVNFGATPKVQIERVIL